MYFIINATMPNETIECTYVCRLCKIKVEAKYIYIYKNKIPVSC